MSKLNLVDWLFEAIRVGAIFHLAHRVHGFLLFITGTRSSDASGIREDHLTVKIEVQMTSKDHRSTALACSALLCAEQAREVERSFLNLELPDIGSP